MTTDATFVCRYDRRVQLVREAVQTTAKIDDKTAATIAVEVLRALDKTPETVR